jgi:hypothetical protein
MFDVARALQSREREETAMLIGSRISNPCQTLVGTQDCSSKEM